MCALGSFAIENHLSRARGYEWKLERVGRVGTVGFFFREELGSLFGNCSAVLYVELVSKLEVNFSVGPDFGYNLAARKFNEKRKLSKLALLLPVQEQQPKWLQQYENWQQK